MRVIHFDTPRQVDEDASEPLWELLRELHARGAAERIGYALTLLLDERRPPRVVFNALLQEAA